MREESLGINFLHFNKVFGTVSKIILIDKLHGLYGQMSEMD